MRDSVTTTIQTLGASAAQKGLQLVYHVESNVPYRVVADPGRLRQILTNLVSNGINSPSAAKSESKLKGFRFAPETTVLHFSVSDTGIGIPPEKEEFIFEPFTQADTSSVRKFGGTGLGLANRLKVGRDYARSNLG